MMTSSIESVIFVGKLSELDLTLLVGSEAVGDGVLRRDGQC